MPNTEQHTIEQSSAAPCTTRPQHAVAEAYAVRYDVASCAWARVGEVGDSHSVHATAQDPRVDGATSIGAGSSGARPVHGESPQFDKRWLD